MSSDAGKAETSAPNWASKTEESAAKDDRREPWKEDSGSKVEDVGDPQMEGMRKKKSSSTKMSVMTFSESETAAKSTSTKMSMMTFSENGTTADDPNGKCSSSSGDQVKE